MSELKTISPQRAARAHGEWPCALALAGIVIAVGPYIIVRSLWH